MTTMCMKSRKKKRDGNEGDLVRALELVGADVERLDLANGPDLLVGFRGRNWLLEVKNPDGRNRVESNQEQWHGRWRGQSAVVRSAMEAIEVITSG